jgi:hypothetical protein
VARRLALELSENLVAVLQIEIQRLKAGGLQMDVVNERLNPSRPRHSDSKTSRDGSKTVSKSRFVIVTPKLQQNPA